jgi:hypothetical protein
MAGQGPGDAGFGDGGAELLQLAHDAEVALARILPGAANDQFDRLFG